MTENTTKRKLSRQVLLIVSTCISLIISIGAYSKDSIFVRYFKHQKKFSISRQVAIDGTATSGFYANARWYKAYASEYGTVLAPIHFLQYINIRNDSEDPQIIGGVMVEIQKENGQWIPLHILSPATGTIYNTIGGVGGLTHATTVDFLGNLLETNIAKGVLQPHGIVSGWLFLEFPEGTYKDLESALRLRVFSGFGENEEHKIHNIDMPPDATPVNPAGFKFSKEKYDLTVLKIIPENELFKKLGH